MKREYRISLVNELKQINLKICKRLQLGIEITNDISYNSVMRVG